ncbi:MAG: hypothetical protein ABR587_02295 [Candidatus Binatia bacterium]
MNAAEHMTEDRSMPDGHYDATQRTLMLRAEHSSVSADTLPEHRLMIALVRDAIRCIDKYRHARDFRGKRLFAQDAEWVLSDDTGWIYAFARVCETLDLDRNSVRIALGLLPARGAAATNESNSASTVH